MSTNEQPARDVAAIEVDFAEADAEHTAATERVQQTANRRHVLRAELTRQNTIEKSQAARDAVASQR